LEIKGTISVIRPASTSSGSEMKAWKNQIISQIPTFSRRNRRRSRSRTRTISRNRQWSRRWGNTGNQTRSRL